MSRSRRFSLSIFSAAVVVFLVSTGGVLMALGRGEPWIARLSFLGMVLAAVLFAASAWYTARAVNWKRVRDEQRLWESGPLGRTWLRMRSRLSDVWKL